MEIDNYLVVGLIIKCDVDGENDDVKLNSGDKKEGIAKRREGLDCPFVKRRINGIRSQQVRLG